MPASQCPNCSAPVLSGAIFCDNCGYDLRMAAAPKAAPPAAPSPAAPAPAASLTCPVCQHVNLAGARFCENCGSQLSVEAQLPGPFSEGAMLPAAKLPGLEGDLGAMPAATAVTPAPLPAAPQPIPAPFEARLQVGDAAGPSLPLPAGFTEVLIGREDPASNVFPDIDLEPYGGQEAGVSRRHARLSARSGMVTIEDLNTVNGTFLNRQKLTPGQPALLKNGDELRLGKLVLLFTISQAP